MKITILSKLEFGQIMRQSNVTNNNIGDKDVFIISVNNSVYYDTKSYFEGCVSENVLRLYFDDISEPEEPFRMFSEEDASSIVDFVKYIDEKKTENTHIIIHCSAGKNRSGSIGKFISDYFDYGFDRLISENPQIMGNPVVSTLLYREWLYKDNL